MGNFTTLFIFVISFNLLMWMTQASITQINPDSDINIISAGSGGDLVGSYKDSMESASPENDLPGGGSAVETDTGNIFTDIFGSIKSFFLDTLGLKYVYNAMKAPFYFLKALGVDPAWAGLVGGAWYVLSIIIVLVFMFRGND